MEKIYEFLKECKVFWVSTVNNGKPANRPFGAVMEYRNNLYISTGNFKEVYKQMISNPFIQITALKPGTRQWIRVNGKVEEEKEIAIKKIMLLEYPILTKYFKSAEQKDFAVFKIEIIEFNFY